jgi:peptidoglycan/LPS O-acetylase OafA/YrhL
MTHLPNATHYRHDIDGLRAIAVMLVLTYHFGLIPSWKAGFMGVDIFFVISGFLITSIIKTKLDSGTFQLADFYIARVRRLAPALLCVLLMVLVVGLATLFPDDLVELMRQALASQLYVANIYFWKNVNYFGLHAADSFLLHMWSLAVEEQFYLLFPLVLIGVHKYLRTYFWCAIAIAFALSFGLALGMVASKPEATFYLLPTRAWELLAGSLTASAALRWMPKKGLDLWLGPLGLCFIAYAMVGYQRDTVFPGWFALLPVLGTALLLFAGRTSATPVVLLLCNPVASYLGRISYPLYLVHWPINVFATRHWGEQYGALWRIAMFCLSILLAALIYHFIEEPVRRKRFIANTKNLLRGYGLACVATVLLCGVVLQTHGLPGRFDAEVFRLANFVNDKTPPLTECQFVGQPLDKETDFCSIGVSDKPATWMVYGDSHAWAAHAAFHQWLQAKGVAGLFIFKHACVPLEGVHMFKDKGLCFAFNREVGAYLKNHAEIEGVVLVSTWHQVPEGLLTTDTQRSFSKQQSLALFHEKFATTLKGLKADGKRIYLWEPVPGALDNVPRGMAQAKAKGVSAKLEMSVQSYLTEFNFFFTALHENKDAISVSFSPSSVLCQTGHCAVALGQDPLYFDNSHVTRSSATFWAAMMADAERKAMQSHANR